MHSTGPLSAQNKGPDFMALKLQNKSPQYK